ncbi:ComEA family DNA-binding protein [Aquimarina sp. 2304DJ70-9]|uniref:ComEA family DNA-binding protein n=1 Tax=Aquimarina penaris TaxID=3231044 RepID=UPI0034629E41
MKDIKSHFEIHSRFRNGIFLLAILLLVAVLGYYFYPKSTQPQQSFVELSEFQHQIDSLKELASQKKKTYRLKPFNPNFISDHKGYQLGLSAKEMDRLQEYRSQDKWINSISDFKRVSKVSDSLLAIISPLFKFPEWKNKTKYKKYASKTYPVKSYAQKEDLNAATAKQLQGKVNVPDFIAERIVKYRNKLGGFVSDVQLKDVSGLYDNQRKKMLSLFTVKTPKVIEKVNINKASIDDLIAVPYFTFEMALEVRDFIEQKGGISSFNELGKIEGFSLEKIDRIALYLTLN